LIEGPKDDDVTRGSSDELERAVTDFKDIAGVRIDRHHRGLVEKYATLRGCESRM
jgi:hypothetical protein